MFEGHIKVLGRLHVARGPDVAQACSTATYAYLFQAFWVNEKKILFWKFF